MATESEFIAAWNQTGGSAAATARLLGIKERSVHERRRRIEERTGERLISYSPRSPDKALKLPPGRLTLDLQDGVVLVGSDAHLWPGPLTTAQRAFIRAAKLLKPDVVILNGDLFDGARVSRFPAGMWSQEARPNVRQELEACQSFMDQLKGPNRYWLFGNHDARFEARLASLTPEYEGVPGFALKDHFQEWRFGMSLWVNDDVVIKHRWHNGVHAVYNNTMKGGKSIVTGHLHSLKVTPWTDYNGTRYGVDTGTLSDPDGAQFDYAEDNSRNWRAGFAVLTFKDGKLLLPELAQVWDEDHIQFRGRLYRV